MKKVYSNINEFTDTISSIDVSDGNFFDLLKTEQIVIKKYNTSYTTVLVLKELIAVLKENNSSIIDIVKDNKEEKNLEILVGQTNRTDMEEILEPNKYIIKPNGNKLYIVGGSVEAINAAISILLIKVQSNDLIVTKEIVGNCTKAVSVGEYSNTITDNFAGTKLDTDLWFNWPKGSNPEIYTKDTGDLIFKNYRDPDNAVVRDGKLYMGSYLGARTVENGITTQEVYTTKMESKDGFWFRYGYVEFSAKAVSGSGLGCTVWLHGDNSKIGNHYCEFDLPEFFGNTKYYRACPFAWKVTEFEGERKNRCTWFMGNGIKVREMHHYSLEDMEDFSDAFHTYGLEWDENYYRFIVDGEIIFDVKYTDMTDADIDGRYFTAEEAINCYQQPCFAVMSIKAGAFWWSAPTIWPGEKAQYAPDAEDIFDKKFDGTDNVLTVDYFTVYQKAGQLSAKTIEEFYEKDKNN